MALGGFGGGAQLLLRLKADADQAVGEMKRVGKEQQTLGEGARHSAGIAAAALGAMAIAGVREFANLDTGMREVFTLMPGISQQAMDQMTEDVRGFAQEYGLTTDQVIPALYQAISAGVPPDNVMAFMATAAKTARGGVTDLETAMDGLTSVVNAYGTTVLSAEDASDTMFTAVRLGKTTIGELSDALFQVVPVAAASGVTFDQVAAALATMTSSGVPTAVAATNLRGALVELGKEGSAAFDAFKAASGQTFPEFIAGGGTVNEALDLLAIYAQSMGTTVQNQFGAVEAGMAATVLASESGSAKFGGFMDQMAGRAGAAQGAFEMMAGGVGFSFDQLKAKGEGVLLTVGEALAPSLDEILGVIEEMIPSLTALAVGFANLLGIVGKVANYMLDSPVNEWADAIGSLTDAVRAGDDDLETYRQQLIDLGLSGAEVDQIIGRMADAVAAAGYLIGGMSATTEGMAQAVLDAAAATRAATTEVEGTGATFAELAEAHGDVAAAALIGEEAEKALTAELQREQRAALAVWEAEQLLLDARRAAIDPLFALVDAEAELAAAHQEVADLTAEGAQGTDEYEAAVRRLLVAQGDYDIAARDLATSTGASVDAIRTLAREADLSADDISRLIDLILAYNDTPINPKTIAYTVSRFGTPGIVGPTLGFQHGGVVPHTQPVIMNEAGGEIAVLPGGTTVYPHGTSPGGGVAVTVNVAGSVVGEQDLAEIVERQLVRTLRRGGTSDVLG